LSSSGETPRTQIRTLWAGTALLLLLGTVVGTASAPASAGLVYNSVHQFTGGLNTTTLSFPTCTIVDNSASVTLPFDAQVTDAWVDVYFANWSNSSNATGWLTVDVGADGSIEVNSTFMGYDTLNLTADGFNDYLDAQNITSGTVDVPLLMESCPPANGWDLTFYNLDIYYARNVSSNASAPQFSGPISNQSVKVNASGYSNVYLPWYFSDADGDTLNWSIVKVAPSDAGWANVSVSVTFDTLYFSSTNGWLGNLSFRVNATDPADQTASSNNITLQVFANLPPVFYSNISDMSLLVNTSDYLDYIFGYVYDPDPSTNGSNSSLMLSLYKLVPSDPGWSNVSLTFQSGYLYATSSNGWLGNLTFRINATDDAGLTASSNDITLRIRPNGAPVLVYDIADVDMEMDTDWWVYLWSTFEEPDREQMTYSAIKSDPNATGWSYVGLELGGNASGYLVVSHRGAWAGNVSMRVRASDPAGNFADSNEFTIFVRSWPGFLLNVPSLTINRGSTNYSAINLTAHFSDLDRDALTYFVWDSGSPGCCGGGGGGNNSSNITALAVNPIYFALNGSTLDVGSNDTAWTGAALYFIEACDPTWRCVQSNDFRVSVVAPPNNAPVFSGPIDDLYIVQGTDRFSVVNLALRFSDPDGNPMTYGIQRINASAPEWAYLSLSFNGSRANLRSLNSTWVGTLQVQFYARDSLFDQTLSNVVTIRVVATDRPPLAVGTVPSISLEAGSSLSPALDASLYFSDPEALPLLFEVVNPSASEGWLWLDLVFTGASLEVVSRDVEGWFGTVTFVVRATDVVGSWVDSNVVSLEVRAPPNEPPRMVQPVPELSASAGASGIVLANLADYFTDDRYAHRLVFQVTEGPEASWATVDLSAPGGLLTIAFTGATAPGDLTYRIGVVDLRGAMTDFGPFTLHITAKAGNRAPTLSGPALVLLEASGTQGLQLVASDPDGDALRFSVTGAPPGLSAAFGGAPGALQLTHNSFDSGIIATLEVVVDDGWGGSATLTLVVAVFEPGRVPHLQAGADADRAGIVWLNGTVSAYSAPPGAGPLSLLFVVDLVTSHSTTAAAGPFSILIPQILSVGNHTVDITATDGFGRATTLRVRFAVLAPPSPIPELTAIALNGAVASEVDAHVRLALVLGAASALAQDVQVRWFVDGVYVGAGQGYTVTLDPGAHTIRAEATNGIETRTLETQVTATAAPGGTPPPPRGADLGLVVAAGAVGAGLAVVGAGWFLARRRAK